MPRLPSPIDVLNATVATAGLRIVRGLRYGPHPRHCFDLYRPATAAAGLPVVVWFYGGAWQSGARAEYLFAAAALARRGMLVAVPDYRLYPEVRYPAFLEDAARAVAGVDAVAGTHGGDGGRMVLAGHSAGAYIAAMLALDGRWLDARRRRLAGAVGIAGPYDFLPILGADIRAVFAPAADDLPTTQPISHADGTNPPMLLLHGDADNTCYPRNSLALAARVRAADGPVAVRTYPGIGHIGMMLAFAAPFRRRCPVLADMARFVAGALAPREAQAIQPAA